ncbi:lactonase family protein [Paenibacillus dakarensis]|uniref:lactonase family protein n=1 Tax=Paenibacillus dakarensis TaxID=1527293 RepID=UPI0006D532DC|nr:lactonase family protein [Paenibacillus dakarensis]
METATKTLVFTGSYAESHENGICVYSFLPDTGDLTRLDQVSGIKNPTFLNVNAKTNRLYAIGEVSENGQKRGEVITFEIDPSTGSLHELSRIQGSSSSTCHIQRDPEDQYLIVSSYHGGCVGLISLDDNGVASKLLDEQFHDRYRSNADQQPRAHSAFFSPDGKYVFVQDLGLDKILAYQINKADNALEFHGETMLESGSGPRHLAFHPSGKYAYVINELNSTVTVFRYNKEGSLETIQTLSTLPDDFAGESYCAEIAVSEDGQHVYGSNRGHDSIVVFAVEENSGELSAIQFISTEGGHPRHFSFMPGGQFMMAANRDGNNLVLFTVNPENGLLHFTGKTVEQSKPVCVKPAVFTV